MLLAARVAAPLRLADSPLAGRLLRIVTVDRAYSLTSSDVAVPEVWRKALLALVPAAAAVVGDGEGDDDALDDAGIMPPSQ